MIARLRVLAAGPLSSIQDAGRPGWRRYGVPPSGPVDRAAFAIGHAALGNPDDAAAIELSLGGIDLLCEEGELVVALAGARFTAALDGATIEGWTTMLLRPGMRLRVRDGGGNWGYLALAGTLDAAAWLGSRSTHFLAGLGGGRIAAGDLLTVVQARTEIATGPIAPYPDDRSARFAIVTGPQQHFFAADALERLTAGGFVATARFDRMGMALDGPALMPTRLDMPSEPIVRGSLQMNGEGRVTALTADHQTTGGYPRIATLAGSDSDRLAQLTPGSPVQFDIVTPAEAIVLARARHAALAAHLDAIRAAVRPRPSLFSTNLIGGVVDALR